MNQKWKEKLSKRVASHSSAEGRIVKEKIVEEQ